MQPLIFIQYFVSQFPILDPQQTECENSSPILNLSLASEE